MPKLNDLSGKRFGRLTVLSRAKTDKKEVYWLCQCDCGKRKKIRGGLLTTKDKKRMTRSCGCLIKESCSARQYLLNEKAKKANKPFFDLEKGTYVRIISSKKLPRTNTSGVKGVSFEKSRGKWRASLKFKGKNVLNKRFDDFDDAVKARKNAEEEYFTPVSEKAIHAGLIEAKED